MRSATRRLRAGLANYNAGLISFAELEVCIKGWIKQVGHADSGGLRAHVLEGLRIRPAEHRRAIAARCR